jgi:transcriptional regulator
MKTYEMMVNEKILYGLLKVASCFLEQREYEILKLRIEGKTLQEIGVEFGISRERVREIEAKTLRNLERIEGIKVLIDKIEEKMTRFSIDNRTDICEIFDIKIANALNKNKIKTIFDLKHFTFEKLLNIKNIGYRFAGEIEWRMSVLGHSLESNLLNRPIKYIDGKGWEFE